MTQAEHIIELNKFYRDRPEELEKEITKFLEPDFIPKNPLPEGLGCPAEKYGMEDIINIKKALGGMRCVRVTGEDIQSGLLYCGKPAYLYAESKNYPGVFYILCKGCSNFHRLKLNEE